MVSEALVQVPKLCTEWIRFIEQAEEVKASACRGLDGKELLKRLLECYRHAQSRMRSYLQLNAEDASPSKVKAATTEKWEPPPSERYAPAYSGGAQRHRECLEASHRSTASVWCNIPAPRKGAVASNRRSNRGRIIPVVMYSPAPRLRPISSPQGGYTPRRQQQTKTDTPAPKVLWESTTLNQALAN